MFATDRDLLALEPRLFIDVGWTAQTLVNAPSGCSINSAGTTLTIPGVDLEALSVGAGFVALVNNTPLEVVERLSATQLLISRLRAGDHDPAIPAAPGSNLSALIATFRPQIAIVHAQVLRALGLRPGVEPGPAHAPTEAQVTNPRSLALAESLGALHLVFASASSVASDHSIEWAKARLYRERFAAERARIAAAIDLNNDGAPETPATPPSSR